MKTIREYINLIEGGAPEVETTQYYNLQLWKRDAKRHGLIVRVGEMAGALEGENVKIYEADSVDQLSGGRFFAGKGPRWNYGHLTIAIK